MKVNMFPPERAIERESDRERAIERERARVFQATISRLCLCPGPLGVASVEAPSSSHHGSPAHVCDCAASAHSGHAVHRYHGEGETLSTVSQSQQLTKLV